MSCVFWSPQDEVEYLRQEIEKVTAQRNTAFKKGFNAGAVWALSTGIEKVAEIFGDTAENWPDFPPELVKAFSEVMKAGVPTISTMLTEGLDEAMQKAGGSTDGAVSC